MEKILFNNFVRWQCSNSIEEITKKYANQYPKLNFDRIKQTLEQKIQDLSLSALIQDIHNWKKNKNNNSVNNEEEYREYNELFLTVEYQNIFKKKYPLLFRKINKLKNNFCDYTCTILDHIVKDQNNLLREFEQPNIQAKELLNLKYDKGDTHNGGKSVVILEFSDKKLVYKPHSLSNERFFNYLLKELNSRSSFNLKTIKNLDCFTYGYQEFVEEEIPQNKECIKSYYLNLGALTSIAYFLTLSDIHFDNILISNDSPVFYDIETLFSVQGNKGDVKHPNMINNVLNTSILPTNPTEVFQKLDVSGMFGNFSYKDEYYENKFLINEYTSDIQFVQKRLPVLKKSMVNNSLEKMDPFNYLDNYLDGFSKYSSFLFQNKTFLIDFIFKNLDESNINRVVPRDTQLYFEFLEALHNANYLQDTKQENKVLDLLYKNKSLDQSVINSEVRQLRQGDIPYFYHSVTSKDLNDYEGMVSKGYIDSKVHVNIINYIETINKKDIDFQQSLIEKSFLLLKDNIFSSKLKNITSGSIDTIEIQRNKILEVCKKYLDNLLNKNLFYIEGYTNLLCTKLFPEVSMGGIDYDLYENFGILLLLAKFDKFSNSDYYRQIVSQIFEVAMKRFEIDLKKNSITISVFAGIGSIIYMLSVLYDSYKDDRYFEMLERMLNESIPIIDKTENLDYIDGLSGFIVAICNIQKNFYVPSLKKVLEVAGERFKILLSKGNLNIDGIGIAHGVFGLIYALLELENVFPTEYNKQTIVNLVENISDSEIMKLQETTTWCRGIVGILPILSRLSKEKLYEFPKGILDNDFLCSNGSSLCHGIAGNLLTLQFLGNKALLSKFSATIQTNLINQVKSGQFKLNQKVPLYQNAISGLMLGETGVVYCLLNSVFSDFGNVLYLTI